jgi:hypothetical protein
MHRTSRHYWALRTDRALKPIIEQVAAAELRTPSAMLRTLIIESLERRGLMQRPALPVDRGSSDASREGGGE